MWSCEGERVSVPIELSGISPWTVHYKIVGQKNVHTVEGVQDAKTNLDVAIPPKIAKHGGSFTLSLGKLNRVLARHPIMNVPFFHFLCQSEYKTAVAARKRSPSTILWSVCIVRSPRRLLSPVAL